jgi:hypothetical protein
MKLTKEQRQKKRCLISVPVSFPDPAEKSAKEKKVHKATTADLGISGLGIYSDIELQPDTVLEIECQDIWDTPKKFSVQWCNKVKHNFYRIGLEAKDEI